MQIRWVGDFEIRATANDTEMTITANRDGLLSLANILRDLAEEQPGSHVHLDEHNSLEEGSIGLIIERTS